METRFGLRIVKFKLLIRKSGAFGRPFWDGRLFRLPLPPLTWGVPLLSAGEEGEGRRRPRRRLLSIPLRAYGQTGDRAQVRHLGQGQCRVHHLLRQGAREQGRHRAAAAAPPVQPQRPRGRPVEGGPCAVVEAVHRRRPAQRAGPPPPAGREQQQRAGRQGRRAEQVRAAAAVLRAAQPPAAAPRRRIPPPPFPGRRPQLPPVSGRPSRAAAAPPRSGAGPACAVRLHAEQPTEQSAEAVVGRAQVRRVGRPERRVGRAGLHGAVREGEAGQGRGQGGWGAGGAAPAAVAGAAALESGQPLLFQDVWVLPPY